MTKFRKKPVVVEAVQYRAGEQPNELANDVVAGRVRYCEDDTMLLATLEGEMRAQPGDWIIRGVKGELYPCKPDIFAATYEPAGHEPLPTITPVPNGWWVHKKSGKVYEVIATARTEAAPTNVIVVYRERSTNGNAVWTRPIAEFRERFRWDDAAGPGY